MSKKCLHFPIKNYNILESAKIDWIFSPQALPLGGGWGTDKPSPTLCVHT